MKREVNIQDFNKYRRGRFHNPLFNLLTTEFDDAFLEKNIDEQFVLEKYYVENRSPESVTDSRLFSLFSTKAKTVESCDTLDNNIRLYPGMIYCLLGKKGMGKTILLRHYYREMTLNKKYIKSDTNIIVMVDLKSKKGDKKFKELLPGSLMEEIFYIIKRDKYLCQYFENPDKIREIDNTYKLIRDDSILASRILDKKEEALEFLFNWAYINNYGIHIIVDNVDDFPAISIKTIIDKCIELKDKFSANCIISLRDYWHPNNLRIDDTNICSCNLGKPDVFEIIKKRLSSIDLSEITGVVEIQYGDKIIPLEPKDIIKTFHAIVYDLMHAERELHEEIYRLSNYNTREYLKNIYHFFHSPYLYTRPNFIKALIAKIKSIDPEFEIENPRPIRFWDFIECFMAIHSLCYDIEASLMVNLFYHEWQYPEGYNYKNTLIFIRILQLLPINITINKNYIIEQLTKIGYEKDAIINALNILFDKALIESIDGAKIQDVNELFISAKGIIYIQKLLSEYSYLVFVCDNVPMPKNYKVDIVEKFGKEPIPLERGNLRVKDHSILRFIDFIESEETTENRKCPIDYKSVLNRITDGEKIAAKIKEDVLATMRRMAMASRRKTKKVEAINIK